MGSSVQDICRVQIGVENGQNVYEAFTDEAFSGGEILVVLSKTRNTKDLESRIAVTKEWRGQSGICRCEPELLEGVLYLYLYLMDAQGVASNVVRVFLYPPKLLGYQLGESGVLYLMLDITSNDYMQAQKLTVQNSGAQRELQLPDCSVKLPELGIWESDSQCELTLSYFSHNDEADVCGPALADAKVLLRGPDIDTLSVEDGLITASGSFQSGVQVLAEILSDNVAVAKTVLPVTEVKGQTKVKWNITGEKLDRSKQYTFRLSYLGGSNEKSRSNSGTESPLLLAAPTVRGVYADKEYTLLYVDHSAQYEVRYGETAEIVQGERLRLAGSVKEAFVRLCQSNSFGPFTMVNMVRKRFLSFEKGGNTFYVLGLPPVVVLEQAIEVPLGKKLTDYEEGTVFSVTARASESVLTIQPQLADRLIVEAAAVYDEFEDLLISCAADFETMQLLTGAVLEHAPLRAQDVLAFQYRYRMKEARADLLPGLLLSVEYTMYQNIPESKRMLLEDGGPVDLWQDSPVGNDIDVSHINGYVGNGTSSYQVVLRNGKIVIEPFIQGFTGEASYQVCAPAPIDSQARIDGGAGAADLLFDGLAAPFVRLLYPVKRLERNTKGNLRYFHNVCLTAGRTLSAVSKASAAMRKQGIPEELNDVAIADMRGLATMTLRLLIIVNGAPQWVSMGTTVKDVMDAFGYQPKEELSLYRRTSSGLCPIFGSDVSDIYVVSGDVLEVK